MNKLLNTLFTAFGLIDTKPTTHELAVRMAMQGNNLGHKPTPAHGHGLRGAGYTQASKEQSKAARKMSSRSRRINRGGSKRS